MGLSIMSPSNMSSADGPRLVRTGVALAILSYLQIAHESNYPIPAKVLVSFAPATGS